MTTLRLPLLLCCLLILSPSRAAETQRPNIVFLLADDLGYGDLGCYGQTKIHTPNLDRLSAQGMRLTTHYAGNNVCAPSRCVLMTGLHPGHAYIRDNRPAKGYPEGQVPVPENYLSLPLTLKKLGYTTGAFGKWGLGPVGSSGEPARQGIDRFFGYNCQAVAHNYYPTHRTPRATYAAMVTRMDRDFGRVFDLIRELGLDDRTIFIFTSDNGPLYDKYGGTDTDFFNSAGIFRGRKGSMYEGGVREPCIVRWAGRIAPGTENARVTGFEDWLPTLLELIGAKDATPANLDGVSVAPTLLGQSQPPRALLYRESPGYGGQQSVRVGNWKAIRQKLHPGLKAKLTEPGLVELYDLEKDPAETTDVAAQNPQVVEKLSAMMREQHVKSDVFPMRALDGR